MVAKHASQYVCQSCGAVTPKWSGRCESCGEWNAIIEEPLGGAHRDFVGAAETLRRQLSSTLAELMLLDPDTLVLRRRARFENFGHFVEK